MATNSIGVYEFAAIQGVPGILTDSVEVIERANVDGTALRGLGRRGQQFTVRTIDDQATLSDCRTQLQAYEALVGFGLWRLVVNDVDYQATEGMLFAVLAVAPARITKAPVIVGGLNVTSGAVLYAAWQLKAIEV